MGDMYGAMSFLAITASDISDQLLADFLKMESSQIVTMHIHSIDQNEAIKTVKHTITELDRSKIEEQKKAVRAGYDMDIIPSDLATFGKDAKALLKELQSQNERMFLLTFTIMNTGKTKEQLENNIFQASSIAQKHNCNLVRLDFQQEQGLMSSLPLAANEIEIQRGLTTSSTAIFVPFTTQELFQGHKGALYYGLNALSNNLIMVDRKMLKNPNGLILGTPGSGKSFSAKREIANSFLVTDDDVIICDPESEYSALVHKFNGQVIKISPTSDQFINPMDINMNYSDDDNPIALKADFILSLCELIVGGKDGLQPVEKTVIDRCIHGEVRGMSLFTLLYPSKSLAQMYSPIDSLNAGESLERIEKSIRVILNTKLDEVEDKYGQLFNNRVDERWYYLAPMLMDGVIYAKHWIEDVVYEMNADSEDTTSDRGNKGFLAHIDKLNEYLNCPDEINLGRRPDDLIETLINMVLGSPAVCIYRTNGKSTTRATALAKVFVNNFNIPESIAIIDLAYGRCKDDNSHWQNVLKYCKDGCFQAMIDEYNHMLGETAGFQTEGNKNQIVHEMLMESLRIHTATYTVDTYQAFRKRIHGEKNSDGCRIRSSYAVGYIKDAGDNSKVINRKESIRNAFNSPMRPFVLATTSIGQEGLDFHNYCRVIMHWNLPSNPIDLEQREGRINRFKCLAIRQNVAQQYGNTVFKKDIWKEMFEAAVNEKQPGQSELVPFWCFGKNQQIKIERLVIWNKTRRAEVGSHKQIPIPREQWTIFENAHEPIVSQELFDAANARAFSGSPRTKVTEKRPGLLVCGSCGRRVALNGSGKGYRCAQASVTSLEGCQCAKRNRYIIEDEILSTAKDKAIEELELLRKNKPKWHHAAREWKGTEALQNKADKLSEKKIRLYDHYKDGKITKEEYLERVKAVTDKLEAIRGQLAEIHIKASEAEYNLSASVELEERLKKVKNLEEYDTRVLKLILEEVIVKTDGTQEYHWTTNTSWRS